MSINHFPEIKTERLLLRRLAHSDWEMISYLRSDETVNKYVDRPSAETREEAISFIDKIESYVSSEKSFYWCISLHNNKEMIGSICLWNFSEDKKTAEVGYDLHPHFQGKGIMNEALNAILDFSFSNLNLERVEAFTHCDNESSRKLLLRNNFIVQEGRTDEDNSDNIIYAVERKALPVIL